MKMYTFAWPDAAVRPAQKSAQQLWAERQAERRQRTGLPAPLMTAEALGI